MIYFYMLTIAIMTCQLLVLYFIYLVLVRVTAIVELWWEHYFKR